MTRCFLGFELSDSARGYLCSVISPLHARMKDELGWPVRLVPPDNWHATLLFFGDLDQAERAKVWEVVKSSVAGGTWRGLRPDWRNLSLWPSPRRPGLVCLEAPVYEPARDWPLTGMLDAEPFCKGEGQHLRDYRPHVTVMRFRRGRGARPPYPRQWERLAGDLPPIDPQAVTLQAVSFFLSTVSPQHPIYPRERTLLLGRD